MGDEDDALPLRPESPQDRRQLGDFARREIGGRLVEDHELRVTQHGFQDLDPLPAAERQVGGRALLTDVVSPAVRDSLVEAFSRASTLLIARAADNQSWWCRVYAFRKVRC